MRQKLGEEPELLREIVLEACVIVQMIARNVGEGARREHDAVEAALLQAVARRFERKMGDAILGEGGEDAVKLDRVRRRVGKRLGSGRAHKADGAEARSLEPLARPKLAHEGRNRRLAVGAGHGDNRFRLSAEEARGDQRQTPARIAVLDDRGGTRGRLRAFGHEDHGGAALQRIGDEAGAVGFTPGRAAKR